MSIKNYDGIMGMISNPTFDAKATSVPNVKEALDNLYCHHQFEATHQTDEHGVLIWKCCCGKTVSSM